MQGCISSSTETVHFSGLPCVDRLNVLAKKKRRRYAQLRQLEYSSSKYLVACGGAKTGCHAADRGYASDKL